MFVHLTKKTEFLVRVRLCNKRTNTNELLTNGSRTVHLTFGSFAALLIIFRFFLFTKTI
ncbi:hypothetical protein Hanom_Chr09g00760781 [Helianthus anomalus]